MRKLIIAILIIILIGAGVGYQFFFREQEKQFSVIEAETGDLTEQVSVTGSLVPFRRIKIEPKLRGEVEQVLVEVSDPVERDDLLIKLDQDQARIQVQKSRANLNSINQEISLLETKLNNAEQDLKQAKQTTAKNINKAEASLEEAQVNLNSKQQNLVDVRQTEDNQLAQQYEDARDSLNTNLATTEQALLKLDRIQETYFYKNNQISTKLRSKRDAAKEDLSEVEQLINKVEESKSRDDTISALDALKTALDSTQEALRYARNVAMENSSYKNKVSSSDKTTLDTEKSNVNTALTKITSAKQSVEIQEISSQKNINSAQAAVDTAKSQLNSARKNLSYVESQAQQKITQAQSKLEQLKKELDVKKSNLKTAQVELAQAQQDLEDTTIKAPTSGIITKVEIEKGETAKPGAAIVSIIPKQKYKIEADVSEVNIGAINKRDRVEVDFDAFPNQVYPGQVYKIHPAEIVKEGVIYYRIEVLLDKYPEKLKPGFTANLDIIVGQKKNVVTVPYVAVKEDNQGEYVEIIEDGQIKEKRRVKTGLEGNTMIEITQGLQPGEKVVLYK